MFTIQMPIHRKLKNTLAYIVESEMEIKNVYRQQ